MATLSSSAGCIAPATLDGRACPCAPGFMCCEAICVPDRPSCLDPGDANTSDLGAARGETPADAVWSAQDTLGAADAGDPTGGPQNDSRPETSPDAGAPTWQIIDGFAGGLVNTFNLQVASDGALYLAVSKPGPVASQIVTVESYDGHSWRALGGDRPISSAAGTIFALAPDDTPYLLNNRQIERFLNAQWSTLPPMPSGLSLTWDLTTFGFDGNGWLNVPAQDAKNPPSLSVMSWNGGSWAPVGGNATLGTAWGSGACFGFDSSRTYLAVNDSDRLFSALWRFAGSAWERLPGHDVVPPAGQLAVTRGGKAYLATTRDGALRVVSWSDGPGWQELPRPANAVDNLVEVSLALDPDDNLYAAYVGDREPGPDIVMGPLLSRWDGKQWVDLAMTGVAPTLLTELQLRINRHAGKTLVYLAMRRNDDLLIRKCEVLPPC